MDSIPSLLGLALRAGRLAVGEEPVGAACRGHKAYLLLLASDAADNTIRRASHFSQSAKNTICLQLPLTKAELGSGLGRTACAMAALTDVGFAAAVAQRLAQSDPAAYGPAWQALSQKASQAKKRRDQKHSPHKDKGSGNNSYRSQPYRLTGAERKEQTSGLAGLSRPGRDGGGFI